MIGTDSRCRKGTLEDLDALCKMTHECFPASLKWHPAFGYVGQWWKEALKNSCVHVLVVDSPSGTLGFAVVILDEERWNSIVKSIRVRFPLNLSLLTLPVTFLRRIGQALVKDIEIDIDRGIKTLSSSERVFVSLSAVSVRARRQGIGKKLGRAVVEVAKLNNALGIQRRVDRNNVENLTLQLKSGYTAISVDKNQYTLLLRFN